jgi:hypothetical protein
MHACPLLEFDLSCTLIVFVPPSHVYMIVCTALHRGQTSAQLIQLVHILADANQQDFEYLVFVTR